MRSIDLEYEKIDLEHPAQEVHGDYATNLVLGLWGKRKKEEWESQGFAKPVDLAEKVAECYRAKSKPYLAKIEVAGPGFINFWLSEEFLVGAITQIAREGENFGNSQIESEAVMVEFAHPNTHKAFHLGHLRNITTGEAIARILGSQGFKVFRTNYQGDIGLHVAKCLWGVRKKIATEGIRLEDLKTLEEKIKFLSEAYVLGNKNYDDSPDVRKEIEELNLKIYQKSEEIASLWQETRDWSLEYFDRIYQEVDVKFDRLYFESEMADLGKKLVLEYLRKGVFEESEGAIIFPGEKYDLHNRVFLNSRGLPTYEAKDLALAQKEFNEFPIGRCLHVVGPEQRGYFDVLFKALEFIDPKIAKGECHLMYGWVRLKTGKMSSRSGEVVLGEWLLNEVKSKLKETYQMTEETAELVSVGAVKYSFLKVGLLREISFDIDESISLEGNSGPYLQYVNARIKSVLAKSSTSLGSGKIKVSKDLINAEEMSLLRGLHRFPEVVQEAAGSYAPNLICSYLFDLAQKFNLFYQKHPILKANDSQRDFRLGLTAAVGQVVENGLRLLGIAAPEKM